MKTNGKQGLRDRVISLINRSDATQFRPVQAFHAAGKVPKLTETLLVVGDKPAARQLKVETLSRRGYRVLQAQSAEQALRIAREAVGIHLLITDFAMPEVDGLVLSHRFRSIHPRTPVLMLSGSWPALRDGTADLSQVLLLAKPFALNELLEKVRMLLNAAVVGWVRKPWAHD